MAVVPAAGLGSRMGGNTPKQYLSLGGLPLLVHSLQVFQSLESIREIILSVPSADQEYCWHEIVKPYDLKKVTQVVAGGKRRQGS